MDSDISDQVIIVTDGEEELENDGNKIFLQYMYGIKSPAQLFPQNSPSYLNLIIRASTFYIAYSSL